MTRDGSLLARSTACADFILDLQSGQALMVQDFTNVALVEQEVGVAEVHESDTSDEENHPRVVALARGLERIVTELVTVWQVMDVVLFFPSVAASVAGEVVVVAKDRRLQQKVIRDSERFSKSEQPRALLCHGRELE